MPPTPWPFIRTFIHRDTVRSTSDLARERITQSDDDLPLLIHADRQTSGRGRGSNAWWSDDGSLTFTVALDPAAYRLRPEHEPRIALTTAVAAIEAIEALIPTPRIGIRWPNDLEIGDRKLGGILPERVERESGLRILVGVGINVHTRLEAAPPDIQRMATSLAPTGITPHELLRGILTRLFPALEALARDDVRLVARWQERDTLRGRHIEVDLGTERLAGVASGIDARGALRLTLPEGERLIYGGRILRG
jgi:BirA family biotin operon repressor/biotin-[acetyl-CoA-carboxylase] ligase